MDTVEPNVALLGSEWGDPEDLTSDRYSFREDCRLLATRKMEKIVVPWTFPIRSDIQAQLRRQEAFQVLVTTAKRIHFIFNCEDFTDGSDIPAAWVRFILDKYTGTEILGGRPVRVQLLVGTMRQYSEKGAPLDGWKLWEDPTKQVPGAWLGGWRYVFYDK